MLLGLTINSFLASVFTHTHIGCQQFDMTKALIPWIAVQFQAIDCAAGMCFSSLGMRAHGQHTCDSHVHSKLHVLSLQYKSPGRSRNHH
jgi:hypothetical protein